ncbi:hypothetical protein V6N13_055820 [Hibiscus sabdariffa]
MVPRRCRALMLVALARAGSIIVAILGQPHQDSTRVSRNVEHSRTDPVTSFQVVNFSAPLSQISYFVDCCHFFPPIFMRRLVSFVITAASNK